MMLAITLLLSASVVGSMVMGTLMPISKGLAAQVIAQSNVVNTNVSASGPSGTSNPNGAAQTVSTTNSTLSLSLASPSWDAGESKTLSGTLLQNGQPLANTVLTLSTSQGTLGTTNVTTNGQGVFSVAYTAPITATAVELTVSTSQDSISATINVQMASITLGWSSGNATTQTNILGGSSMVMDVSIDQPIQDFPGYRLVVVDAVNGQVQGTFSSGTNVSVSVSGSGQSSTYVAYLSPMTNGNPVMGSIATSQTTMNVTWSDPSQLAKSLQIQAQAAPSGLNGPLGAAWTNGTESVWNGEPVKLTASLVGLYAPPSAGTLSVVFANTQQALTPWQSSSTSVSSMMSVSSSNGSITAPFAATFTYPGGTTVTSSYTTNVTWLNNNSLNLSASYQQGTMTLTATSQFAYSSSTANGPYTYEGYLYNLSTGQWYLPYGLTGSTSSVSWSLNGSQYSGQDFVAYVEDSASPTAGQYPSSASQPPLESQVVEDATPVLTGFSITNNGGFAPTITLTGTGFGATGSFSMSDFSYGWYLNNFSVATWSDTHVVLTPSGPYGGADLSLYSDGNGSWILDPGDDVSVNLTNGASGQSLQQTEFLPSLSLPSIAWLSTPGGVTTGQSTSAVGEVTDQGKPLANVAVVVTTSAGSLANGNVPNGMPSDSAIYFTNGSGQFTATVVAPSFPQNVGLTASVAHTQTASTSFYVQYPILYGSVGSCTISGSQTSENCSAYSTGGTGTCTTLGQQMTRGGVVIGCGGATEQSCTPCTSYTGSCVLSTSSCPAGQIGSCQQIGTSEYQNGQNVACTSVGAHTSCSCSTPPPPPTTYSGTCTHYVNTCTGDQNGCASYQSNPKCTVSGSSTATGGWSSSSCPYGGTPVTCNNPFPEPPTTTCETGYVHTYTCSY